MDPHERFCHNRSCWAYARAGEDHIVIHSQKEQRYRCKSCGQTFSATKGSALYRAHKPHALLVTVVTLLAYGCPPQAMLAAYPKQALKVLREPLRSGKRGRPRLLLPDGVMVAQAIKRYARRRETGVLRRIVRGTEEAVRIRLNSTQGSEGAVINTAYIERFQATLRSQLAPLVRRTRAAARQRATLAAGMWLVGTVYNFCCWHRSLRLRCSSTEEWRWVERTAGLADHRWSLHELLAFPVPPTPPKRRGRRPRWLLEAACAA